jgi:hypothetical protein
MTRTLLLGLFIAQASMLAVEAEAKPRSPEMCGGGCTCERLLRERQTDPIGYSECQKAIDAGVLGNGPKYHFACSSSSVWCCQDNGEGCFPVRPAPSGQAPLKNMPQAPLQSAPGQPQVR